MLYAQVLGTTPAPLLSAPLSSPPVRATDFNGRFDWIMLIREAEFKVEKVGLNKINFKKPQPLFLCRGREHRVDSMTGLSTATTPLHNHILIILQNNLL